MDLKWLLDGCVNALGVWFILVGTAVIAFGPYAFVMALFIDNDYRAKWKGRALTAYTYVRAFIDRHRGE